MSTTRYFGPPWSASQCFYYDIHTVSGNLNYRSKLSRSSPTHPFFYPTAFNMTKDGGAIQTDKPATADNNAIVAAVETQLSLVSSFDRWLSERTEIGGPCRGVVDRVRKRVDDYRAWLLMVQTTPGSIVEDPDPWAMEARVQPGDDGSLVVVTGPGAVGPIEVTAKDKKELGDLMSVCRA